MLHSMDKLCACAQEPDLGNLPARGRPDFVAAGHFARPYGEHEQAASGSSARRYWHAMLNRDFFTCCAAVGFR